MPLRATTISTDTYDLSLSLRLSDAQQLLGTGPELGRDAEYETRDRAGPDDGPDQLDEHDPLQEDDEDDIGVVAAVA